MIPCILLLVIFCSVYSSCCVVLAAALREWREAREQRKLVDAKAKRVFFPFFLSIGEHRNKKNRKSLEKENKEGTESGSFRSIHSTQDTETLAPA